MDESHTILALRRRCCFKIKHPYKDELQRIFNFKFPYEYIDRYQEMLDRKEKVKSIYKQFLLFLLHQQIDFNFAKGIISCILQQ